MLLIENLARGSIASQHTHVWSSKHGRRSTRALSLLTIVANRFEVSALRLAHVAL